ncbi:hypothetical protein [Amycolatopsis sp. GA6-003]|uniref:hypothetical protein n=1 Tax=Amycolatopsis sp. GA6-003 TaxID=2652444 RepID=UPI0039173143
MEDGNGTVEIQVAVHRARGEAPLKTDELSSTARAQLRAVLDPLKKRQMHNGPGAKSTRPVVYCLDQTVRPKGFEPLTF